MPTQAGATAGDLQPPLGRRPVGGAASPDIYSGDITYRSLSLSLYIYIYTYIYICTYTYIYIYIYVDRERERERERE